jgi:uncharacterized protein (DUF58 family)
MLSTEQIKAIRKIQIRTSHLVSDLFGGQYQSVFKGRGMEFAEVRQYLPGDDVRTIDWNVTARTGIPHVKRFCEERELTVMLLVDVSGSTHFGSAGQFKQELAAELAALLAFSAIANNDKVGLVIFTDRVEFALPPRKGNRHVLRVVREILNHTPAGSGTDIPLALDHLNRVTHRRCVVFLLSDFMQPNLKRALRMARRRHDVVGVVLEDPREIALTGAGMLALRDAESGREVIVDTSDAAVREAFRRHQAQRREDRDRLLRSADIDAIRVRTGEPYTRELMRFFRERQ